MKKVSNELAVSELWIYPVKSLSGLSVMEAKALERGLEFDRRWMIVDENNRFLTQRELPEMALIQPSFTIENEVLNAITFSHKHKNIVPFVLQNPQKANQNKPAIEVIVWDDKVFGVEINDEINFWLSNVLNFTCKLVYMTDEVKRNIDQDYAITGNEITSFSDGYPFLILGQQAMELLNSKLDEKINIVRFRPNIVFSGGVAHEEDTWVRLQIANTSFIGVKNCARCPVPTINQETGLKGKEPLKTLATYRFKNNKVYFGQNLLIDKTGIIKVGDLISLP